MNNVAPAHQARPGFAQKHPTHAHGAVGQNVAQSFSSVPYAGEPVPRQFGTEHNPGHKACMFERANGQLCRGPRAKGTEYCIGHLRHLGKLEAS
jgi:hypothetical protein